MSSILSISHKWLLNTWNVGKFDLGTEILILLNFIEFIFKNLKTHVTNGYSFWEH